MRNNINAFIAARSGCQVRYMTLPQREEKHIYPRYIQSFNNLQPHIPYYIYYVICVTCITFSCYLFYRSARWYPAYSDSSFPCTTHIEYYVTCFRIRFFIKLHNYQYLIQAFTRIRTFRVLYMYFINKCNACIQHT